MIRGNVCGCVGNFNHNCDQQELRWSNVGILGEILGCSLHLQQWGLSHTSWMAGIARRDMKLQRVFFYYLPIIPNYLFEYFFPDYRIGIYCYSCQFPVISVTTDGFLSLVGGYQQFCLRLYTLCACVCFDLTLCVLRFPIFLLPPPNNFLYIYIYYFAFIFLPLPPFLFNLYRERQARRKYIFYAHGMSVALQFALRKHKEEGRKK